MIKNNVFVKVHQDCFKNANKAQTELYMNLNVVEMKLVLVMLAHANMINSINKNRTLKTIFKISLKNCRKKDSILESFKYSKKELSEIINEIKHPYFEHIYCENEEICFELKKSYINELNTNKGGYVALKDVMRYKTVNQIKMHFQLTYFRAYKVPLYFAINFLDISKKQARKDQIRSIKNLFKSLKIENECEYFFPKAREQKTNLHYNFVVKIKEVKNNFDDNIFF